MEKLRKRQNIYAFTAENAECQVDDNRQCR